MTFLNTIMEEIGPFHRLSVASGVFLWSSYVAFSTCLQYRYYYVKRDQSQEWKVEPAKTQSLEHSKSWWLPLVSYWSSKERAPFHALFATLNLTMSCVIFACLVEAIIRGKTKIYFDYSEHDLFYNIVGFLSGHVYQCVLEYYWHIGNHWGPMYRIFHKIHHYYKNPEPFDDMYIHPVEAFGYYCILFSPPLVLPMHLHAFLAYMVVNGITGMLDHSGIRFRIPNVYDTADHDAHHSKFNCNYAFPFPYLDIMNGTYYGSVHLFGKEYKFKPKNWASTTAKEQ